MTSASTIPLARPFVSVTFTYSCCSTPVTRPALVTTDVVIGGLP
jgi:hypothetical protein